jgi:polyhydroxyalkanoate synthesis repressor PhaR
MIRLIKRYGSRKLYDTEESRYVSLEELGAWIREGQEIKVVDNESSADVTAQTLTLIILEEGKKGTSFPTSETLHEWIRKGGKLVADGVDQVKHGVDKFVQSSIDRLGPVKQIKEETAALRERLEQLEETLRKIEEESSEQGSRRQDNGQEEDGR